MGFLFWALAAYFQWVVLVCKSIKTITIAGKFLHSNKRMQKHLLDIAISFGCIFITKVDLEVEIEVIRIMLVNIRTSKWVYGYILRCISPCFLCSDSIGSNDSMGCSCDRSSYPGCFDFEK